MKNVLISLFILIAATATAQEAPKQPDTRPMCAATTKAGTACKHHAKPGTTFCTIHNPETPRCGMPTKSGQPCKRTVKTAGSHCSAHSKSSSK